MKTISLLEVLVHIPFPCDLKCFELGRVALQMSEFMGPLVLILLERQFELDLEGGLMLISPPEVLLG